MLSIFTARRYASAVFVVVVVVHVSVCLSVTSLYCIETTGRIELAFATGLLSSFGYFHKLGYFPLELRPKLRT